MSSAPGPAVLVMAKAPRPGHAKTRLEPLLGRAGCARLQAALVTRAARWAHAVVDADTWVAFDPPDARSELARLVGPDVRLLPQVPGDLGQRIAAAATSIHAARPGPVLVVGCDVPALGPQHARAALDDLADGCQIVVGPALDGGYYLLAVAEDRPELFDLPSQAWGGPEVLALTLARAQGLSLGLLRAERDLDTPDDVRAALADPLIAPGLAELLSPPG